MARERAIDGNDNNNNKSAVKSVCKQEGTMYCSSETAATHLDGVEKDVPQFKFCIDINIV